MHDDPGAGRSGVGLIRARGGIQRLRYGERQEVGEQRRGLRRGLTSGVLLKRVSGAQLTTVATARQLATLASGACRFVRFTEVLVVASNGISSPTAR